MEKTIQISQDTISYLTNLSTMENMLTVFKSQPLKLTTNMGVVFTSIGIDEEFPFDFHLGNLKEFVTCLKHLGDGVEIIFDEDNTEFCIMKNKGCFLKYGFANMCYADMDLADLSIRVDEPDLEFRLTEENLSNILKACHILKHDLISIVVNDEGKIFMVTGDSEDESTPNEYTVYLGQKAGLTPAQYSFYSTNLMMLVCDYDVKVDAKGVVLFKSCEDTGHDITFCVGIELDVD